MAYVTMFCFTSHLEILLQELMAWVNADDPLEMWVGSTPPALQEWEEEGRKPLGQAMCHHMLF